MRGEASMRVFGSALVLAGLLAAAPASAEGLDLSTVKCKDFFESRKDNIGYTLACLDAYYRGDDDPPIIDFEKMKADAAKLGSYCAANPNVGLITAADKLFEK